MAAPYNLAPDSQWEIFSGMGDSTRMNVEGGGTFAPASMTSNSMGTNLTTLNIASTDDITQWKIGDLVHVLDAADPALSMFPMRIVERSVSSPKYLKVRCPLGLSTSQTSSGLILPVNIGGAASIGTGDSADG